MTTIGFGDYTPNFAQPENSSFLSTYYRWILVLVKFIGLAYIGFVFSLINKTLEKVFVYKDDSEGKDKNRDPEVNFISVNNSLYFRLSVKLSTITLEV